MFRIIVNVIDMSCCSDICAADSGR